MTSDAWWDGCAPKCQTQFRWLSYFSCLQRVGKSIDPYLLYVVGYITIITELYKSSKRLQLSHYHTCSPSLDEISFPQSSSSIYYIIIHLDLSPRPSIHPPSFHPSIYLSISTWNHYPLVICYIAVENGPVKTVSLPMNSTVDLSIFPVRDVNVYQRVNLHIPMVFWW